MKRFFIIITLILPVILYSHNWVPYGPDSVNVNNICFETTAGKIVICTNEGIWIDDAVGGQGWSFYTSVLPVWDAESHTDSTILIVMGEGSYSDGIWVFNLLTHQYEVRLWCFYPNFIEYNEYNGKYYAGHAYGLLESTDGNSWSTVADMEDNVVAFDAWCDHIVVGETGDEEFIRHSPDGGTTWNTYASFPGIISDLSFTSCGELFLTTYAGPTPSALLRSCDFGLTCETLYESEGVLSDVAFDAMGNVFISWTSGTQQEQGVALFDTLTQSITLIGDGLPSQYVNRMSCHPWMMVVHIFAFTDQGACYCYDYLTRMEEKHAEGNLQLYPNPAKKEEGVTISNIPVEGTAKLRLFDMGGRLMISRKVEVSGGSLFNELGCISMTGSYVLELQQGAFRYSGKLLIH